MVTILIGSRNDTIDSFWYDVGKPVLHMPQPGQTMMPLLYPCTHPIATLSQVLSRLSLILIFMAVFTVLLTKTATAEGDAPAPKFTIAFVPYSLVKDIPHSGGGKNTSVTFDNRLAKEVKLWWIDGSGGRHSYGTVASGTTKTQGSYAQHVWLITDLQDKPLGYFVASSAAALATIHPGDL